MRKCVCARVCALCMHTCECMCMCMYYCAPVEIRGKLSEAGSSFGIQALNSGWQLSLQTALQANPSSDFGSPLEYVRLESSSQAEMRSVIIYIFVDY